MGRNATHHCIVRPRAAKRPFSVQCGQRPQSGSSLCRDPCIRYLVYFRYVVNFSYFIEILHSIETITIKIWHNRLNTEFIIHHTKYSNVILYNNAVFTPSTFSIYCSYCLKRLQKTFTFVFILLLILTRQQLVTYKQKQIITSYHRVSNVLISVSSYSDEVKSILTSLNFK